MKKIDLLKLKKVLLIGAMGSQVVIMGFLTSSKQRRNSDPDVENKPMYVEVDKSEPVIEEKPFVEEAEYLNTPIMEDIEPEIRGANEINVVYSEPDETNKNLQYHYRVFEFTDENPEGIKTICTDYATYTKFQDGIKDNRLYQYLYASEVIGKKCKTYIPYDYYAYNKKIDSNQKTY